MSWHSQTCLFVRNHLAAWPESCLGERRQCLATANSSSESEIPPPSQALKTQVSLTHCILQLLPAPSTFSHQKPRQGSHYNPSSEAPVRVHSPAQRGSPRMGTRGDTRGPNPSPATKRKFMPIQHPSKPQGGQEAASERSVERGES